MTRDDIIRMAREVGIVFADHTAVGSEEYLLQNFAALVAAAERDHLVAERNVLIAALEQIEITTYDSMTAALARVAIDKVGGARLA